MNNSPFEEAFRTRLEGAQVEPSADLWSRIDASLDSAAVAKVAAGRRTFLSETLRWGSLAAASLLVALGANMLFFGDDSLAVEEFYMAHIEEFEEFDALPIALGEVRFDLPQRRVVAAELAGREVLPAIEIEQSVISSEEGNISDSDVAVQSNSSATTDSATSQKGSQATWRSADNLVSPLSRRSLRRSPKRVGLLLAASGGSSYSVKNEAGSAVPYSLISSQKAYVGLFSEESYKPIEAQHHLPISFALTASYGIGERWSVVGGLSYSRLMSDVTMPYSSKSLRQKVEFVGLPIRLNYDIHNTSNFSLYAGAGGQIERCISSSLNGSTIPEKPWHTSLNGVVGAQYNILDWVGIYAEPALWYYLTPTNLTTIRTEMPLSFNVSVGVRFNL